jgi:ribose transport system permease protein
MQIVEVRLSVFLDRSKIRYGLAWYASFWSLFDFKLAIVIMGALISTPILCRAQSSGSTLQQMVVTGQVSPGGYSAYGAPEGFSRSFIAIGMTFVLIIGGIDLSVGSVLALGAGILGVAIVQWHWPLWAAICLCILSGALCGLLNGFLTIRFQLPSFIVTLGLMEAARGATYLVTNWQTMYIGPAVEAIDNVSVLGLSLPFLVAITLAIVAQLVLTGSVFGRYSIALGTNEEAVRLSGIDTRPIKLAVFTLSGALAALGGVSYCAQLSSADPNGGSGFELAAIAAVVIGGTSLMGGRGSVINSLFGVLVIAVLETGLAQIGAQESVKRMVTGGVIIIAVIVDFYRTRRAEAKARSGK